jgi:hypothetical protein
MHDLSGSVEVDLPHVISSTDLQLGHGDIGLAELTRWN